MSLGIEGGGWGEEPDRLVFFEEPLAMAVEEDRLYPSDPEFVLLHAPGRHDPIQSPLNNRSVFSNSRLEPFDRTS